MTALNEDFFDLLSALIREDADFIVVGAHALAVHGVARATGDLDVLVRPDVQNAARDRDLLDTKLLEQET